MDEDRRHIAKLTGWAGLTVAALTVLAALIGNYTGMPDTASSAQDVADYYSGHRGSTLAAAFITGIAWCGVFLVFLVGLRSVLAGRARDARTDVYATIGLVGGAAFSVVLAAFVIVLSVLGFRSLPDALAEPVHNAFLLANAASGYATAVCVAGFLVALSRAGGFPGWLTPLGFVVIGVHVLSAASLASDGSLSPSGFFGFVAPPLFTIWMATISVVLLREAGVGDSPGADAGEPAGGASQVGAADDQS